MTSYISLTELKVVLDLDPEEKDTNLDAILKRFCIKASRMFDTKCTNKVFPPRRFYPKYGSRLFGHPRCITELRLRDDLLEIDTLTTGNGVTTIDSGDYFLYTWPNRMQPSPYNTIGLLSGGVVTSFTYSTNKFDANAVAGWWGFHNDWGNAWESSGDSVQDDPLASDATSISVNDIDGADIYGLPYRFQPLQLIRIGDEYLTVVGVDKSTNTMTVIRGVNGTTAAEHAQGTAIYIYRPMDEVRMALEYLAMHLYKRKDSIGTPDQRPLAAAKGLLVFPASMPREVQDIIDAYSKDAL